jgi:hypothetical protein
MELYVPVHIRMYGTLHTCTCQDVWNCMYLYISGCLELYVPVNIRVHGTVRTCTYQDV